MACNISSQSKRRVEEFSLTTNESLMVAGLLDQLPLNIYNSDKDGVILYKDNIGLYVLDKNKDKFYVKSNYEASRLSFFENSKTIIGTREEALSIAKSILPNINENEIEFIDRVANSGIDKKDVIDFFGKFSNGIISINETDGLVDFKVLKHELVHKVINEYMSLSERDSIFNYVRTNEQYLKWLKYNNLSNSDFSIEEYIADYYSSGSYKYKVNTIIDNAITTIRRLFTGYLSINSSNPLDLFYKKMNSGYYKNKIASYSGDVKYSAKTFNNTARKSIDLILNKFQLFNSKNNEMYQDYDKIVLHSFFTDNYLSFLSKRIKAYNESNPYLFDFESNKFNKDLFTYALNSLLNKNVYNSIKEVDSISNISNLIYSYSSGDIKSVTSLQNSIEIIIEDKKIINSSLYGAFLIVLKKITLDQYYLSNGIENLDNTNLIDLFLLSSIRSRYYKENIINKITSLNINRINEMFPITIDVIQSLLFDKNIAPTFLSIANRTEGTEDYLKDIINSKSLSIQDLSKIEEDGDEGDLKRTIEGHKEVDSSKIKTLKHMMYLYGISTGNVLTIEDISEELSSIKSYKDRVQLINSIKEAFDSRKEVSYLNSEKLKSNTFKFINSLSIRYNQASPKIGSFNIDYNNNKGLYQLGITVQSNKDESFNVDIKILDENKLIIGSFGKKIRLSNINDIGRIIMKDIFSKYAITPKFNYSSVIESEISNAISSSMVNDSYHGLLQLINSSFIDGTVFEPNLNPNKLLEVKKQSQSIQYLSTAIDEYIKQLNKEIEEEKAKDEKFNVSKEELIVTLSNMFPRLKNFKGLEQNDNGTFSFKVNQSNFRKKSKVGRSTHSPVSNPTSMSTKVGKLERILGAVFKNGAESFDDMNPIKQALMFIALSSQKKLDQFPLMAIKDRGSFFVSKRNYDNTNLVEVLRNLSDTSVSKIFPSLLSEIPNIDELTDEALLVEFKAASNRKAELFLENVLSELMLIKMSKNSYIAILNELINSLKTEKTLGNFKDYYYNTLVNNILTHSDVFGSSESQAAAFKNTATYFKRAPVTLTPGTLSSTSWFPESYFNAKRRSLQREFKNGIKVLVVKSDSIDLSPIFSGIESLKELASSVSTPMDGATFYRQDTMEFMKEFHNVDFNAQSHKNVVSSKVGDTHFQLKHNSVSITQDLIDKYPYYKAINDFMIAHGIHVLTTPDSAKVYNKDTQFVDAYSIHDIMTGKALFDDEKHAKKIVVLSEDQIISLNTLEQQKDHVTHAKQEKVMFFKGIGPYSTAYGNFLKYHYANYSTNIAVNRSEMINRTIRSTSNETYANGLLLSNGQFPMFNAYAMMTATPSLISKTFRDVIAPKLDGLKGLLHPDFGFVTFSDRSLIKDEDNLKEYDKQLEQFNKLPLDQQEYLKMYNALDSISDANISKFGTLIKIKNNIINHLTQDKIDSFNLIKPSGLAMFDKDGLSDILLPERFKESYDKLIAGYKSSNPNSTEEEANEYASSIMLAYGSRIPNTSVSSNRGYKVKGFIKGERVVVPWLVMAVSGHDNDGDALFTHLMAMNNNDHVKFIKKVKDIFDSIDSTISDLQSRIDSINSDLQKEDNTDASYLAKRLQQRTMQIGEYNRLKEAMNEDGSTMSNLIKLLNKYDLSENSLFGMLSNGLMENESILESDLKEIKDAIDSLRTNFNVISYNTISKENTTEFLNNGMALLNHNKAIREKAIELGKDSHLSETLSPIGFALFNKVSDKDKFNSIKDVESASDYMRFLLSEKVMGLDTMKYFDLLSKVIEYNDEVEGFISLKELNKILTFSEAKLPSVFELDGIIDSTQDSKIQGIAIGFIAKMLTSFNAGRYYNGVELSAMESNQNDKALDISNKINLTTNAYIDALKEDTISITGLRNPALLTYLAGGILMSKNLVEVVSLLKSMPAKALERYNYEKELDSTILKDNTIEEENVDDDYSDIESDVEESGGFTSKLSEKSAPKYQVYTFAKYALISRNREKKLNSNYEDTNNFRKSLVNNSGVLIMSEGNYINFKGNKDYLTQMNESMKTIFGSSITDIEMKSLYDYLEVVFNKNIVDINALIQAAIAVYNNKKLEEKSIFKEMTTETAIVILKLHALNRMWSENEKELNKMSQVFKENSITKFSFIDPPISILDTFNRISSAIDYINNVKLQRGISDIKNATDRQLEGLNHIFQIAIGYVTQYSAVLKSLGFDPSHMYDFVTKNSDIESINNTNNQKLSDIELLINQWDIFLKSIDNSTIPRNIERSTDSAYLRKAKRAVIEGAGYGTLFKYKPKLSKLDAITFKSRLIDIIFLYMDTNLRNNGIEPLFLSMKNDNTLFEYGIATKSILDDGRVGYETETLDNILSRTLKNIKGLKGNLSYLKAINNIFYETTDKKGVSMITLKDNISSQELLIANNKLSIVLNSTEGTRIDDNGTLVLITKEDRMLAYNLLVFAMAELYPAGANPMHILFYNRPEFDYARNPYSSNVYSISTDVSNKAKEFTESKNNNIKSNDKYDYSEVLYGKYKYQSVYSIADSISLFIINQNELGLGDNEITKFAIVVKKLLSRHKFSNSQKDQIIEKFKENNPSVESISDVISLFKPLAFAIAEVNDDVDADINSMIKDAFKVPYSISNSIALKYEKAQKEIKRKEQIKKENKYERMRREGMEEFEGIERKREVKYIEYLNQTYDQLLDSLNYFTDFTGYSKIDSIDEQSIEKFESFFAKQVNELKYSIRAGLFNGADPIKLRDVLFEKSKVYRDFLILRQAFYGRTAESGLVKEKELDMDLSELNIENILRRNKIYSMSDELKRIKEREEILQDKLSEVSKRDFFSYDTEEDFSKDFNDGKFTFLMEEDMNRYKMISSDLIRFKKLKKQVKSLQKELIELNKKSIKLNQEIVDIKLNYAGNDKQNKVEDC